MKRKVLLKTAAVLIFIIAAIFGAAAGSDFYGDIPLFLTILIIIVALFFMGIAAELWKIPNKKKEDS